MKRSIWLLLLCCVIPEPSNGQSVSAARCKELLQLPAVTGTQVRVVFDPDQGRRIDGQSSYPAGTPVLVVVRTSNPFRFDYKVQIEARQLNSSNVSDFLTAGIRLPGVSAARSASLVYNALEDLELKEYVLLRAAIDTAERAIGDVATVERDFSGDDGTATALNHYRQAIAQDGAEPDALCETAVNVWPRLEPTELQIKMLSASMAALKTFASTDQIQARAEWMKIVADRVSKRMGEADPPEELQNQLEALTRRHAETSESVSEGIAAGTVLLSTVDSASATRKRITEVLQRPDAFYTTRRFDGDVPVAISVQGFRLEVATNTQTEFNTRVTQVGSAAVHLTAGIAFSTVNDVHVVRQQGADGAGGANSRFGYDTNSRFKPSGVLMLNVPIQDSARGFTVGPAAGLVVGSDSGGATLEYMLGFGLGLGSHKADAQQGGGDNEWVFLNFGLHFARVEQLAGGFVPGQEIPADLPDPLPVERNWQPGFMLSLTFRLR